MTTRSPHLIAAVGLAAAAVAAVALAASPRPPRTDSRVAALLRSVSRTRIERDIRRLAAFGTRHTLSADTDETRGIGAARRWLRREMETIAATSGGRLQVEENTFTVPAGGRFPRATPVTNVVATLPGTDPNRLLVVGAHLDSRASRALDAASDAPGADDDASGIAAVLELARAMAPHTFRATAVFIGFSAEEQGLNGSAHWAEAARAAGRPIEAMLNNDIIGNTRGASGDRDDRHVRLFSEGVPAVEPPATARLRVLSGADNDSPSRELARAVADAQRRYLPRFKVRLVYRRDRYLRGGDHNSFSQRGYAAVRFTEALEDWRHQHQDVREADGVLWGDRPEFVDYRYVANVTRVNLAALADLAWAPPRPAQVRLRTRLQADTTLRWERFPDADRIGYEVLWRVTTAPDWEGARFVGDVEEVTLPLSKDETLFAVRAVGSAGNRGLPAFAVPETAGRGATGTAGREASP